jgi:hypothetical protein
VSEPYHSALGDRQEQDVPGVDRFELEDSVAFVHDIFDAELLPAEYAACDVLYLEPPWRDGFGLYERRTGNDGRNWNDLMRRAGELIVNSSLPAVVTISRWTPMPEPDYRLDGRQNELPCSFWIYGDVGSALPVQDVDLVAVLARDFERVGDFFCGYGRSARIFAQHGKRFTVSDYNARCIGYIAREAASWT